MSVRMQILPVVLFLAVLRPEGSLQGQNIAGLKEEKPFSISGTLGGSMMFYDVSGRPASRKPFVWMLTGSPTVSVYGIRFPFSFVMSKEQRDFRQPFNKFGVSPYYKWVKLHLGYRNINWSPYSMAGHTIFGAGAELTPGRFQFGFLYGRLLKAIEPDALTYDLNQSFVSTPAYERKALAAKFGYGTEKNNAALIFMKGWDDPGSLRSDSLRSDLLPAENVILTFLTHQQIWSHFNFDLQLSQSLYTNDINSGVPDSASHGLVDIFSGIYTGNATTYTSNALETTFGYSGQQLSVNIRFKQIDPGYRSMGAYFFQNDIRNITFEPALHFGKQKYNVSGSIGFQRDNLQNDLPSTTHRTIGSLSFTASPSQVYNANITWSNYDMGQSRGSTPVDSLYEISQTTQNLAVNQNLNFTGTSFSHLVMLTYNFQRLKDKNENTADMNSYNSSTLMANYMISVMDAGLALSLGYNYTLFNLQTSENRISGPSFSVTKSLLKKKLSLMMADHYFRNALTFSNGTNDRISGINRISFSGTLKPSKHHRFYVRIYINQAKAKTSNFNPFTERKGDIGYVYSF
ncbi:MAG TPA: hypothetical protein VE870_12925 [Bacteroidales bacterium]|nr:hypothetical protein [Bacteroidales bacterium]